MGENNIDGERDELLIEGRGRGETVDVQQTTLPRSKQHERSYVCWCVSHHSALT